MLPVIQFAEPNYYMIGTELRKLDFQGTDEIHVVLSQD